MSHGLKSPQLPSQQQILAVFNKVFIELTGGTQSCLAKWPSAQVKGFNVRHGECGNINRLLSEAAHEETTCWLGFVP